MFERVQPNPYSRGVATYRSRRSAACERFGYAFERYARFRMARAFPQLVGDPVTAVLLLEDALSRV